MKSLVIKVIVASVGVFTLAACAEGGVEPRLDDLGLEEQMELAVLGDPGAFGIAVELADVTSEVAVTLGNVEGADNRSLNAEARAYFDEARSAMLAGDRDGALALAREARLLVAQGLQALGGDRALEALIERIEDLAAVADDEVFVDAEALGSELESLATLARSLDARGDALAAAERAMLGEQLARHRRGRRHHPDIDPGRARLAVALARTAVALAQRLINAADTPTICPSSIDSVSDVSLLCDRNRWLWQAKRLLAIAEEALANGHLRRAVHFAQHAQWSALKAVILPGGIEKEELWAIAELAKHLYEEAAAAVGDAPTELDKRLLNLAADLIEVGIEKLESGHKRGVAPLWRAAVICRWLLD